MDTTPLNPVIYNFISRTQKFSFLGNNMPDMFIQGSLDRFCYFIQRSSYYHKYWEYSTSAEDLVPPQKKNVNLNFTPRDQRKRNDINYRNKIDQLERFYNENVEVNFELKTYKKNPDFLYLTFDEINLIMNETQETDTVTLNQISHFYDSKKFDGYDEIKKSVMEFDLNFINERKRILYYCKKNNLFSDVKTNWNIFWLEQKDNELFIIDAGSISYKDIDGEIHTKLPNRIENTLTSRENLFPRNTPFCVTDISALNSVNSETCFIYYFSLGKHIKKENRIENSTFRPSDFKFNFDNLNSNYTVHFSQGLMPGNTMSIHLNNDALVCVEHQGGRFKINNIEYSGEAYKFQLYGAGTTLNIECSDYPTKRFWVLILENK